MPSYEKGCEATAMLFPWNPSLPPCLSRSSILLSIEKFRDGHLLEDLCINTRMRADLWSDKGPVCVLVLTRLLSMLSYSEASTLASTSLFFDRKGKQRTLRTLKG